MMNKLHFKYWFLFLIQFLVNMSYSYNSNNKQNVLWSEPHEKTFHCDKHAKQSENIEMNEVGFKTNAERTKRDAKPLIGTFDLSKLFKKNSPKESPNERLDEPLSEALSYAVKYDIKPPTRTPTVDNFKYYTKLTTTTNNSSIGNNMTKIGKLKKKRPKARYKTLYLRQNSTIKMARDNFNTNKTFKRNIKHFEMNYTSDTNNQTNQVNITKAAPLSKEGTKNITNEFLHLPKSSFESITHAISDETGSKISTTTEMRDINSSAQPEVNQPSFKNFSQENNGISLSTSQSINAKTMNATEAIRPIKHAAILEGDLVLGGLMMVHSREDTKICGPIMPQGGIQALEAMLYTLDVLNKRGILPNFTLGAHVLDDCDKDTYGLEMAVDFIKENCERTHCGWCRSKLGSMRSDATQEHLAWVRGRVKTA